MSTAFQSDEPTARPRLKFLQSLSPDYLDYLEGIYFENPDSLSPDIALFFDALDLARQEMEDGSRKPSESSWEVADELRVSELIEAYRQGGHLKSKLDPLGVYKSPVDPHLGLNYFGLDKIPADRVFQAAKDIGLPPCSLNKIVDHLERTYCQFLGVEYHYIRDEKIRTWLKERIEKSQNKTEFSPSEKVEMLKHVYKASLFESFLQTSYTGQKRFSLEGGEALIPALKAGIQACGDLGAKEVVIGMAHRGRLNVLVNVMEKPYQDVFKEFEGAELPDNIEASGDVKYHNGYSSDIRTSSGVGMHLSLAPNPSHLEWVNPVVEGVARAKQDTKYDCDRSSVVPFLIHGDGAVIGQGVVPETLNLAQLEAYKTGGTIHIVINNQIGFTTLPEDARSSLYCTDFGKAFQIPIFHVNGDQIEDVVHAMRLATEFRMKFQLDCFIDIWCYRKYGHNEADEPRFTQPLMYKLIESHPSPLEIYSQKLILDKSVDNAQVDQFAAGFKEDLNKKREIVKSGPRKIEFDMFRGLWAGLEIPSREKLVSTFDTSIAPEFLDQTIKAIHSIPQNRKAFGKFQKMLETRMKRIEEKNEFDWAAGELIAMGSLLLEGNSVRLTGQDCVRGTFSHRHSAMRDSETGERYFFLDPLAKGRARLLIHDSPLSEAAVMGFEYGYAAAQPQTLVMWEAQFGDFANSAQVIIDQFIASAEAKWYRMNGLVLLLPHGYEGQGPEHSSARLERFLQLCAQENMQVTYPTTPAQYCHLLRRQVRRSFRKPLIVMTPKSPLRMPEVVSPKEDFLKGGFQPLLVDHSEKAERVLLCSGKVYWDLKKEAAEKKVQDRVAIIRVEQLYPLDKPGLKALHQKYEKCKDWRWVQEEPKNMGAWMMMKLSLLDLDIPLTYVGRRAAASPATGSYLKHEREQRQLIEESLRF